MSYTFLSDDWLTEVHKIRAEAGDDGADVSDITVNVTVTGGPEGDRELHLQKGAFDTGHVEAPTKLTVPYEVARQMFLEGDQQAAMQAFMAGQIKVEGDMSKLMQMQSSNRGGSSELTEKIKAITA